MTGTIYIARIGRLTKIGHTRQPVRERLRQHKYFFRQDVVLLCTVEGSRLNERELHDGLRHYRVPAGTGGPAYELFAIPDVILGMLLSNIHHMTGGRIDDYGVLSVAA